MLLVACWVCDGENIWQRFQLEIRHKRLQLVRPSTKLMHCHHQVMQQLHFQSKGTFLRLALCCAPQLLYSQRSAPCTKLSFRKHWINVYDREITSIFQMIRLISFSQFWFLIISSSISPLQVKDVHKSSIHQQMLSKISEITQSYQLEVILII